MTDSGQPPSPKFEAEDELDYLFANASPNPNREGCPSRDELIRVSRQERPIGDPVYMHIVRCSPCFREMRALQQARARSRRGGTLVGVAAAVVALVVGASWWMARSPRGTEAALVAVSIDLRPFAVMRGDAQPPQPPPIAIPRGHLAVTMLLPLGSEPGPYQVQLRGDEHTVRVGATGEAQLRGSATTLGVALDTTALEAGDYRLDVRRIGGASQDFPVQVR